MRIISGSAKGKPLLAPKTRLTRPMTDEIREAVFNILGPIDGFKVLDVYAGSGAIGLEALSREASSVDAIEISGKVGQIIKRNVEVLGFSDRYKLYIDSVEKWIKKQSPKQKYDLIFIDPPFDHFNSEVPALLVSFLPPQGILELRTHRRVGLVEIPNLKVAVTKNYGDSVVTFYTLQS